MHPYATDSDERRRIWLVLAFLALLSATGLHAFLTRTGVQPPWWVDIPSPVGFLALAYAAFDRWIWRWRLWRRLGLVSVPDLSGTWKGSVTSSHESGSEASATVRISQTWTSIGIALETSRSTSRSLTAAVLTKDPTGDRLIYEYLNEPRATAEESMQTHRGTAVLAIRDERLEGDYYTGRGRTTHGTLSLTRHSP